MPSLGSSFTLFTVAIPAMCGNPVLDQWTTTAGCPDAPFNRTPTVIHNNSQTTPCIVSACFLPTLLMLQPDKPAPVGIGGYTVVRWTAPRPGTYGIRGIFQGLDFIGPATSDVHVVLNSTQSLLSGPITRYNLPLSFANQVKVKTGDTIDFAMGIGYNGTNSYDNIGLAATLTRVSGDPE